MPSGAKAINDEADRAFDALLARTDAHPDADLGDAYLHRRVADILTHLHAWHVIFEGWISQARTGATPAYPAEGYTWRDLDALNEALYEAYHARSYAAARSMVIASHRAATQLVATFSDDELARTGLFDWLGPDSLGSVAREYLGGHYAWAQSVLDAAGVPRRGDAAA